MATQGITRRFFFFPIPRAKRSVFISTGFLLFGAHDLFNTHFPNVGCIMEQKCSIFFLYEWHDDCARAITVTPPLLFYTDCATAAVPTAAFDFYHIHVFDLPFSTMFNIFVPVGYLTMALLLWTSIPGVHYRSRCPSGRKQIKHYITNNRFVIHALLLTFYTNLQF